jgi:DNA-binding transcriptional ArsR family regulator
MPGSKPNVDQVFHALGDATRRAILERLSKGPISVSQLAEPLDMTLAAVVQHLQILEESGLVRTEKAGRVRICQIEPAGLSVAEKWIADRRTLWQRRLDRLGELLDD